MTDRTSDKVTGMVLLLVCCGLSLFLLTGGSLAFLAPSWPIAIGIVATVGVSGLGWYLRQHNSGTRLPPSPRGCA